ncbi:Anaphase-promoting complex/cyclosome 11 isoform 1 [Hibiscus syriacus]|uniref:Anaphase-promoting complex/cyclosome 11 isoform 1 n=1 Tax=Hibiscus syriacus TaxID=106335 RepID=A0A6A3AQV9_HIBSY|nr:Anaphase-promoting complex/cyclosome 11 isoform 1 [Hibiscus syriacus]
MGSDSPRKTRALEILSMKVNALQDEVVQSTTSDTALLSPTLLLLPLSLFFFVGRHRRRRAVGCGSFAESEHQISPNITRSSEGSFLCLVTKMKRSYRCDTRNPADLDPSMFEGVTHVICCTATTAFPSKRWDGDNTPERVAKTSHQLYLCVYINFGSIMNLFGVLKYKKKGKTFFAIPAFHLPSSDGPYTSYDLNTLLQATSGQRRRVVIGQGDKPVGEVSRLVVAEACIQALDIEFTEGKIYGINSVEVQKQIQKSGKSCLKHPKHSSTKRIFKE